MTDPLAAMTTIPSVLRRAAERYATLEAVVEGSSRVTFAEVASHVELIESALIASAIQPGDRVGLWAPNGLDWILTSFAVYGVGGILVPINTRYKGGEAAELLRSADVRMLFTVTDFLGTDYVDLLDGLEGLEGVRETVVLSGPVPEGSTSWPTFLGRAEQVEAEDVSARQAAISPEDPSDIIFTSGTTGLPKGAVLRHGASVETYEQWSEGVGLHEGDRMLVVYPFFHTAGLKSGILAAFIRGTTLVPHAVFEVRSVVDRVAEEQITVLPGPPSIFQSILSHSEFASFQLNSLRLSVTGAAVVPVELIARMKSELGLEAVLTAYGLTETHGTVTICEQSDTIETIATTVGHPLDGLELRIVDDEGTDQPTGEPGEVLVRGFNVMSGYFNAPEATAAAVDQEGWLHTGDVGTRRQDGYLRIVDRKKDIFIVGGFNVSAAEVESIILRRPDVTHVAVVAAPDQRLGEVGAAFVVPRSGFSPDPVEITSWCRENMANFKAPRYVHLVDTLPITSTGKVQKPELRERAGDLVRFARWSESADPVVDDSMDSDNHEGDGDMTTIRFDDVDALNAATSTEFGEWGPEITVTQEMIDRFAELTGDRQWIHVDVERALEESPFGGPVAHGFLTLSLIPHLMAGGEVRITGHANAANYGADKLRFVAPVPAGSPVHSRSRLVEAVARPKGTLVTTEIEVAVVGAQRPALLYSMQTLYM